MTRVTVLVATRMRERVLPGCLESLVVQTHFAEMEVVVVHGPGGDDREIAADFPDPRIRWIASPRVGLCVAWNVGIRVATGEYLMTLNSDDRLRGDAVELLANGLDGNPDVSLVYGDSWITSTPGETFDRNSSGGRRLAWPDYSHGELLRRCIIGPHPMWRRQVHRRIGLFDESFVSAGDYEMWLRMAETERMLHLPEVVGLYHENPEGLSRRSPQTSFDERRQIVRRYLHRYRDIVRGTA